jgi:hypothetical protein
VNGKGYAVLCLLLAGIRIASAQNAADHAASWQLYQDSVVAGKTGKPFLPEATVLTTTDGRQINGTSWRHNTFVYCGMYGCAACKRELPVILELAAENQETDFLYLTHDGPESRSLEFEELLGKGYMLPANFAIVQLSIEEMKRLHIFLGYPAKYFLDQKGIVRYFRWGGESMKKTKEEVAAIYNAVLHADK